VKPFLGKLELWRVPGVTNRLFQEEKGCTHEGVTKWKREVVGVVSNQFHAPKEEALPISFTKRRRVAHTRASPNGNGRSWAL
ncbi:2244_t:CDS:1, partial [Funneliformis mosseae]